METVTVHLFGIFNLLSDYIVWFHFGSMFCLECVPVLLWVWGLYHRCTEHWYNIRTGSSEAEIQVFIVLFSCCKNKQDYKYSAIFKSVLKIHTVPKK